MTETQAQRLAKLIGTFDNAMLISQAPGEGLHARPMAIAEHCGSGTLYFATSRDAGKVGEDQGPTEVAVTMQGDKRYLSISGHAETVTDPAVIELFFNPSWTFWFPHGKDDPNLQLIKVQPASAEYWDLSKTSDKLQFVFEAGNATVEGKQTESDELGSHGAVALG